MSLIVDLKRLTIQSSELFTLWLELKLHLGNNIHKKKSYDWKDQVSDSDNHPTGIIYLQNSQLLKYESFSFSYTECTM